MRGTVSIAHPTLADRQAMTVRPRGEFDADTGHCLAADLSAAITQALRRRVPAVVVDCADLDFIDAATVHVLLRAQAEATASGVSLTLRDVHDAPARVLLVLGLWTTLCEEPVRS